ncbi:DNA-methyltransferase [Herbaspirillum seropedicae]|uniref:DNA-methyltransferase n=1 Tax=Herbaspirillum seropedicae TaxID=964 RepID=UPI003F8D800E
MNARQQLTEFTLHHGDCLEMMRSMPDASVDSIVTDPPYGLKFMNKAWDYKVPSVEVWKEALRVLKPGGHLLAFGSARTYHRLVVAIEDAGFEVRDQVMWIYGSGFPKSHNLEGAFEGWGSALKPAHEPICMARKRTAGDQSLAMNMLEYGTGALNIAACRVEPTGESRGRVGEASEDQRYASAGSTNFAAKPGIRGGAPEGRWPANVIHDGSSQVLEAFPDAPGAQAMAAMGGDRRKDQNVYGSMARGSNGMLPRGDAGSAARFFYCAKASRDDRNTGVGGSSTPAVTTNATMREREDADWATRNGNHHPTVKPTKLMEYLCRLVTPPGGIVLDPYMGSGSTGKACMRGGFRFIGIDLDAEYVRIAHERIQCEASTPKQQKLFS